MIKTRSLNQSEREALQSALVEKFGVDDSTISTESISSTVSSEMRRDAIVAVIVATICMLLYIWFRFKDIRFASSAVLALLHDVLVVLAFYAIARVSVGNTFIACMLTIVGYSINATIVILTVYVRTFTVVPEKTGRNCKHKYHSDSYKKYLYLFYNFCYGSCSLYHGCFFYP